jgi:uncharacterized protein (DUF4415 family)
MMRSEYDFTKGKRGPIVLLDPGKQRITIRLDANIVDWFRARVHDTGGGNYQTLINAALADWIRAHDLEKALRRVIREELRRVT